MDMTLKPIAFAKAERDQWIQEKLQQHRKQKEKEDARVALEAAEAKERLWSPFGRAARFTNELNIAWKRDLDIFHWSRVLPFRELVALRVTGHGLTYIPTELAEQLPSLQVLTLISNALESLPENIGLLQHLSEVDLTKNKLKTLPASFCKLTNLTYLNLSNNALESLPDDFGNLFRLEKVWVECNKLSSTPPSFGKLRCHVANLSSNNFVHWDLHRPELCNLTTLTLNLNYLTSLPEVLCTLPALTSLSASNNALTTLPDTIGTLSSLRSLRLDWNRINELPYSFRHLHNLSEIHMERNPMTMPPLDVVYQGAQTVVAYMEQRYIAWLRQERRKIVEQLEAVLAALHRELYRADASSHNNSAGFDMLLAYFTAGIERVVRGTTLTFYALVLPALFTDILPGLSHHWQFHPKHRPSERDVPTDFFELPEAIIMDAITNFDDEYTPALVANQIAQFGRCGCIDPETKMRRPCNRVPAPFQCERADAALLRAKMVTTQEFKEMQSDSYLVARRIRLANAMQAKCVAFINSQEGIAFFDKTALECAKNLLADRTNREKQRKQQAKNEKLVEKTRRKTIMMIKNLESKQSRKSLSINKTVETLQRELETIDKQMRVATPAQAKKLDGRRQELVKRLNQAKSDLSRLESNPKLKMLQEKMQRLEEGLPEPNIRNNKSRDNDRGSNDDDNDQSEDSRESDNSQESSDNSEDSSADDGSSSSDDENDPANSFMAADIHGLEPIKNWIEAATEIIEGILDSRPNPKTHVEELVHFYNEHLRDTYTKEKMTKVKNKATTEFYQMRFVLRKWMGFGNRVVFVAWRDYVRETVKTRDTTTRKQQFDEQLAAQNRLAEIELGKLEAMNWVKKINPYTDEGVMSAAPPPYWDDIQQGARTTLPPIK
ncbi:unnamed protein product [Aphanomyces euteiches]